MKALLVLEDGFCLQGKSFTGDFETGGEVIFNTGMTGYQEVLTDPSYYGQMVCMTYPLIGNYGITAEDMESGRVHMRALLVKECCKEPSNWRSKESLPDFLKRWNVPGMEGLDTRALTRHLRINGAMRGIISTRDLDVESLRAKACALPSMEGQNLVPFVAAQKPYILTADGPKDAQFDANGAYAWQGTGIPLLVYDFGVKWNILRLLADTARIKNGKIEFEGTDLTKVSDKQMREIRGQKIAMVFQDPMTTLNPTIPIGKQITEAVLKHRKMSREDAQKLAVEMLHRVGIDDPAQRMLLQPHYFSGGMRQRCVLAIALALNPHILFADEPTTALDVTVQAQMLDLLRDIQRKTGIGIVLVSHDLGVVARIADRVAVMYAGKIVEIGTAEEIFYDPRHPYTWGLLGALPSQAVENGELRGIPGMPPTLLDPPPGDAFAERNQYAMKIDYERMPPMFPVSETHSAATWLLDERAPAVTPPVTIKRRGMIH